MDGVPASLANVLDRACPTCVTVVGPWDYASCVAVQQAVVDEVAREGWAPVLLLLEHPRVVTLGRNADPGVAAGATAPVVATHRGGSVTVHGPGQVVGYLIGDLRRMGLTVTCFVRELEALMQDAATTFGVRAETRAGLTGLWTEHGKLGSIGIAVRRGVSWHGLALYVDNQDANFGALNPCALPGVRPDCLTRTVPGVSWEAAAAALAAAFTHRFGAGQAVRFHRIAAADLQPTAPAAAPERAACA